MSTEKVVEPVGDGVSLADDIVEDMETAEQIGDDLRGLPREPEETFITIDDKKVMLAPANLRDIPKIGKLLKGFFDGIDVEAMSDAQGFKDVEALMTEEKMNAIAEIILLSVPKKVREAEGYDLDSILDNCSLSDFMGSFRSIMGMNDFF